MVVAEDIIELKVRCEAYKKKIIEIELDNEELLELLMQKEKSI